MAKKINHRGEILRVTILKNGYTVTKVAEFMDKSRSTIYNDFAKEFLPNDVMLKYGKVLGFDFSTEIPELADYTIIKEGTEDYISQKEYREKYYSLLEKHIKLVNELNTYKLPKEPAVYKKAPAKKRAK